MAAGVRGDGSWPAGSGGRLTMSLASPLQTNLEDTIRREASLPGCEMLCKWEKMYFLNFSGTIGCNTPVETLPARR